MVKVLTTETSGFLVPLKRLLADKSETDETINNTVKAIIADVETRGDAALLDYTRKFDRVTASTAAELRVPEEKIAAAHKEIPQAVYSALKLAAERIALYHQKQLPQDFTFTDSSGVTLGNHWKPIESIGLYVPGGLAVYPSSVLMSAVPAKVAGVSRLVMVVPTPDGKLNPVLLAAASLSGITEIYTVGGAQAVAALAYGTEMISPVDKIVGPGNAYVAAAKRQLFGIVGIDMIAGPSDILVVADSKNNPAWIAADLLSQAEHDVMARSVLITEDAAFAESVIAEVEKTLQTLPRQEIARQSWENRGIVIVDKGFSHLVKLIDTVAPEHLELAIDNAEEIAGKIRNAGAVFLGRFTPEALGDYLAGPSHVLPTSATARFSSGLSVYDFIKRTSVIGCGPDGFSALAKSTMALAEAEGLGAHHLSVAIRTNHG